MRDQSWCHACSDLAAAKDGPGGCNDDLSGQLLMVADEYVDVSLLKLWPNCTRSSNRVWIFCAGAEEAVNEVEVERVGYVLTTYETLPQQPSERLPRAEVVSYR